MSEEKPIKTNFFENQAKESAAPITKNYTVMILLGLLVIGIIFGAYQLILYFTNLEKNQAINNVAVQLNKPDLEDGVARVDVAISNLNPVSVDHIVFKYNIKGPDGNSSSAGTVNIAESVPVGASRTFRHVKLGPLEGEAARMQAELVDLKLGPKSKLPPELESRFSEIAAMKEQDAIDGFSDFVKKAPQFAPGFIGLGRAYLASGNDPRAEEAFREAIKVDPKNADAHYCLGLVLLNKKNKPEAEKEVGVAFELAPNDPDIQRTIQENRN